MRTISLSIFLIALGACDSSDIDTDDYVDVSDVDTDETLRGVDERDDFRRVEDLDDALIDESDDTTAIYATTFKAGDKARVCTSSNDGLRQRKGPGTSYAS